MTYPETPNTILKIETVQSANPSTPMVSLWKVWPCSCTFPSTTSTRGQKVYPGQQALGQAYRTHRNQNIMEGPFGSRRDGSSRPLGKAWCSESPGLLQACTRLPGRQRNGVLLGHNVIWSHYNVLYVGHYCAALNMQNFA